MLLIENGADINASNGNGCTSLHVAANKGHRDMVSCLIDGQADLNLKVSSIEIPFMKIKLGGGSNNKKIMLPGKSQDILCLFRCWIPPP